MAPTFSVTTPVFNGEEFVRRSYTALREQSFTDWEWIVVDDGSTDRTAELVRRIDDSRVKLISYQPNRGRGHARMAALEAAGGDWVVVWDVDDMYLPQRLARINEARRAGFDFFCSYAVVVDNDLQIKGVRGFHPASGVMPRYFVHPTLACRLDLARQIGYDVWDTVGGPGEDCRMVLTLAAGHRGCYAAEALAIYQEDREIDLRKSIDSNRAQMYAIGDLYRKGILQGSRRSYVTMMTRWWLKLGILNLMRSMPSLYNLTVHRRSYGSTAPLFQLTQECLTFIESIDDRRRAVQPRMCG